MYKLIIPKNVQNEIDYLHSRITTEWSGILGYTVENDKAGDTVFIAVGIYPKNIGTSVSTTFNYKDIIQVTKYFNEKFSSNVLLGSIHTHHTMGAFISGTDESEVRENCLVYNNYLFLVVDTKRTYVASFGRKKIIYPYEVGYIDFDGKIDKKMYHKEEVKEAELFPVHIVYSFETEVPKDFSDMVDVLVNEYKEAQKKTEKTLWDETVTPFGNSIIPSTTSKKYSNTFDYKDKTPKFKENNKSVPNIAYLPTSAELALYYTLYGYAPSLLDVYETELDFYHELVEGIELVDFSSPKSLADDFSEAIETVEAADIMQDTKSLKMGVIAVLEKMKTSYSHFFYRGTESDVDKLIKIIESIKVS